MSSTDLQFWFEFASTYSYPAAERIERMISGTAITLAWKPFLLGPVFRKQGWDDSPFNIYPAKGRYMWRDLQRICERDAIPFRKPSRFPRNGLAAARVAHHGVGTSWCGDFVRRVYRANFVDDREIGEISVLTEILRDMGMDPTPILAAANEPSRKDSLRRQTERAQQIGIFGAPTFVVDGELFWGNDRLQDAIGWCERVAEGDSE